MLDRRGDTTHPNRKRVLVLLSAHTYRGGAFLDAAAGLGVEVVEGVDVADELAAYWGVPLPLRFADVERSVGRIVAYARGSPLDVILSPDDGAAEIAARACEELGLPHNAPRAALAARDKLVMREALLAGGVPAPWYRAYPLAEGPERAAREAPYPCVLKPLRLSGSRGVIRTDDPEQLAAAWARLSRILGADGAAAGAAQVLVEGFIPGREVALEGLLSGGRLRTLALFDKPDPLDGPYFEETIYVTPSRLAPAEQAAISACAADAARALGLREGPVHAELRVNERGPWLVELAGRSIGGLCSSVLRFDAGMGLEELILRHAVGLDVGGLEREAGAAGVMMIPIPAAGLLMSVSGVEEARVVPGIEGVEITARLRQPLVPLPEGASYLGFLFAKGETPGEVEAALRESHGRLRFEVRPLLPMAPHPHQPMHAVSD